MTREERYIEYDERIDRYLRNQMTDDERLVFEQDVDNNQELRERLVTTSMLVQGIAKEGMRREGQAQLDAIKQMDERQFKKAAQGRKPFKSLMHWAAGIAALVALAVGIHELYPTRNIKTPPMAQAEKTKKVKSNVTKTPAEPTLADIANEYNTPFDSEPDAFADIRKQLQRNDSKDMMAVVEDIDKIAWPIAKDEPKGAADEEALKETQPNYEDCTHWYKALAYLKAGEKENAVKELNELIDHGTVEELVNRATKLLEKLK